MAAGREIPDFIADICEFKEEKDGLSTYLLKPTFKNKNEEKRIQVLTLGNDDASKETRSVLLLGETGTGKTRLLNVLVNHIFGVQFEDSFRLELEDQMVGERERKTCSQTDYITAFIIYHQNGMLYDSNFIFIDTPGFNDTRGQKYQKDFMENLRIFLLEDFGIDFLSCIGLLMKASENRELSGQKEVLLSISTLLEDSVAPVTRLLGTFATGDKRDTVIDKIARMAEIQFANLHCFDNWPLYIPHQINEEFTEDDLGNLKYKWKKMNNECKEFLNGVKSTQQVSLLKIRELVQERQKIEEVLKELSKQVKEAAEIIKKWRENEKDKKIFKDILEGYHAHKCKICQEICINHCKYENNLKDIIKTLISTTVSGFAAGAKHGTKIAGITAIAFGITGAVASYFLAKGNCDFNNKRECNNRECTHVTSEHSVLFKIRQDGTDKLVEDKLELRKCEAEITRIEKIIGENYVSLVITTDSMNKRLESLLSSTEKLKNLSSNSQVSDPSLLIRKIDINPDDGWHVMLRNILRKAVEMMVDCSDKRQDILRQIIALVK